jgi:hypothetical protein
MSYGKSRVRAYIWAVMLLLGLGYGDRPGGRQRIGRQHVGRHHDHRHQDR